ncbi:MAG: tetratricopeptide repeat protein [Planctomycetota bacterium]
MRPSLLISACALSSALSTAAALLLSGAHFGLPGAQTPAPPRAALPGPSGSHDSELARLRADVDALQAESRASDVVAWTGERAPLESETGPGATNADMQALEALVRALVEPSALIQDKPVTWPAGARDAAAAVEAILSAGIDSDEAAEMWAEAAKNGQVHALLEQLEARMEELPETADKHLARARAYYAAARAVPDNADGNWWVDSNTAYSKVLELDPAHWDARYQKARNMSFWPPAYGGQAEAARHFEILIQQQAGQAPRAEFARPYQWLGNLYDQQGRTDDARRVWEQGLARFPGDPGLTAKLASLR